MRPGGIGKSALLGFLLAACLANLAPESAQALTPRQLQAAERSWMDASGWILAQRRASGSWDAKLDPALSGMVGREEGAFTTSLGQLTAKQTAAQSGWCRVMACLLDSLGIDERDTVAVSMTGSFPGLNLAVLLTLEAGNIPYRCVSSLGASTYGANDILFNWPLVEDWLRSRDLLAGGSAAITPGGSSDRMHGMSLESVMAAERVLRLHPESLHPGSLRQAIELRETVFGPPERLSLLINIGGSHAVLGGNDFSRQVSGGLLGEADRVLLQGAETDVESGMSGLMQHYLQQGLPILHFSDIVRLARDWGLPAPPLQALTPPEPARDCVRGVSSAPRARRPK